MSMLVSVGLSVLIALAIVLILRIVMSFTLSCSTIKWPAGSKTLPLIGNLHQLQGNVLHVALAKLAKKHGGVMTIWFGSWRPVIVVSNIKPAWEVLVSKSSDYSARLMRETTKTLAASWHTVSTFNSGPFWHNLRKGLQNGPLGPSNISAQSHFQEGDIQQLISDMQAAAAINGRIVKPMDHLKKATMRLLSRLIFGHTFDDDLFTESMNHAVEKLILLSDLVHLSESFSYAKYLPTHRRAAKELDELELTIKRLVRPFLASSPPNSYLDFLLTQGYSEDVIIFCIFELYLLGVDSTSSTTTWALAFLIHDEVVQEKLYEDIKIIKDNPTSTTRNFMLQFQVELAPEKIP